MLNFFFGIYTQFRSIFLVFCNFFSKRETRLYPEESIKLSHRYRGKIVLTRDPDGEERCVACNLCAAVCPSDCISLEKSEKKNGRWYAKIFQINFSRCIFCGLCEEACPTSAIQLSKDVELCETDRTKLLYEKKDLLILGTGKSPDYNFYTFSGVNFKKIDSKKNIKNSDSLVDVKSLLP